VQTIFSDSRNQAEDTAAEAALISQLVSHWKFSAVKVIRSAEDWRVACNIQLRSQPDKNWQSNDELK
jgi:hypothetical protein